MSVGDSALGAYQREIAYVFRTLRWLGVRTSEIEDLAQEVFLALQRCWSRYDRMRPLRPFLFGVAFRVAASHQRKRQREVPLRELELRDLAPDPSEELQAKWMRALVLRALEEVPLRRRAVFVMHELDEVPMGELAPALGIPLFTAYSRLYKARQEFEAAVRRLAKEADDR